MPNPLAQPRTILVVGGIIIVAAVIVGLTKYKIPAANVNLQINTNSSLNTNTMASAESYPFKDITTEEITNKQVRITTAKGEIVFTLDPTSAPLATRNFVYLAKRGYYNGLTFHRVEDDFVIQGGDPNGTGTGGPGYEFADDPVSQNYIDGTVAMANHGADTNGSQFFICKGKLCQGLQPLYSIFGHVTSGMDVVQKIVADDVMTTVVIEPAS